MKLLVIVFVYAHFLSITEGLECYSCIDFYSDEVCTEPTTEICTDLPGMYSNKFCFKIFFNKKHDVFKTWDEYKNCSGDCIQKGCLPLFAEENCTASETFEYRLGEVSCCQGDLCNSSVEDSNSSVKLSDQNVFLCAIVLLVYLFILVLS